MYVGWSLARGHRAEFTLSRKTDSAVFLSQFQFLAPNDFLTIPNPFTFFLLFSTYIRSTAAAEDELASCSRIPASFFLNTPNSSLIESIHNGTDDPPYKP